MYSSVSMDSRDNPVGVFHTVSPTIYFRALHTKPQNVLKNARQVALQSLVHHLTANNFIHHTLSFYMSWRNWGPLYNNSYNPERNVCTVLRKVSDAVIFFFISFIHFIVSQHCRGFKHLSTFVYIIHLVIKTNLARFALILVIFMLGFSQSRQHPSFILKNKSFLIWLIFSFRLV